MPLYLGQGATIRLEQVVAMIDLLSPMTNDTASMVQHLQESGWCRSLGSRPKTLVLYTAEDGRTLGYFSCVGLRTLRSRMELSMQIAEERGAL
jgi:hypothetical protein